MLKEKIAVLGSGGWGTALSILLANNGRNVIMWGIYDDEVRRIAEARENAQYLPGARLPEALALTSDIESSVRDAAVIISAVPSFAVRQTMRLIKPLISKDVIIANAAKGFESRKRLSVVIEEELPGAVQAVLSGPGHAEEVARSLPTAYVAASHDEAASRRLQELFSSPVFRVYRNSDVIGVELGGALKNVVALATGMSDGMGNGDNAKAALMTRGIAEITRLGLAMGARAETFAGLSGIGDLIVTCTSRFSRNNRAGQLIGRGMSLDEALKEIRMTVEGVSSTASAYGLAGEYSADMPIVSMIHKILFDGASPKAGVIELMTRERREEK